MRLSRRSRPACCDGATVGPGLSRALLIVVLIVGAIPLLAPLVWTVSTSLKPEFDVFQVPPQLIPETIRWQNYVEIFEIAPFAQQYFNSVYIALVNVAGTLIVASLAGICAGTAALPGSRAHPAASC